MTRIDPIAGLDSGKRYLDVALFPGTDKTREFAIECRSTLLTEFGPPFS
jgi:hypothetical protein